MDTPDKQDFPLGMKVFLMFLFNKNMTHCATTITSYFDVVTDLSVTLLYCLFNSHTFSSLAVIPHEWEL